jgi:hypothetical protein
VGDRDALLARPVPPATPVTETDLESLPRLMQTYLRRVGVVGQPRVHSLRVQFNAQMGSSATSPWMQSTAPQYEFFAPPTRLFHMNGSLFGVPFEILHRYIDSTATFQVRIASLFSIVDKSGPVLTRGETVTLMNDIVVMALAAVLDLPFTWETIGPRFVAADTCRNAGQRRSRSSQLRQKRRQTLGTDADGRRPAHAQ